MSSGRLSRSLQNLADICGVQTTYTDAAGQVQTISMPGLLSLLGALGVGIESPREAGAALKQEQQRQWEQFLPPVLVAWDGCLTGVRIRASGRQSGLLECRLTLESGEQRQWQANWNKLPTVGKKRLLGTSYTERELPETSLPLGYHRLEVAGAGGRAEALVIAAPQRAYEHPDIVSRKNWGAFIPLYALHSQHDWGSGTFGEMERFADWIHGYGGGICATLPLLAAFLDEPFEPSPYSPASRLFWNEFYLDVERVPELERSPAARGLIDSPAFQAEVAELRKGPLVDYKRGMALKRRVLQELARLFFGEASARREQFEQFVSEHPRVADYAKFRAVVDRRRESWWNWPEPLRRGELRDGDFEPADEQYHLYVQWLCDQQMRALADRARATGPGLYLDLPLGVNSDSYDVWRERDTFSAGMSAGAPPDPFFPGGQNWGFPPLHPRRMREQGYRYLRAYLAHHLKYAGILRLDHIMGLSRLYWIPHNRPASEGGYVSYPADELFALFCLESVRAKAVIVGEDLGTVPPDIPAAMNRHNIHRMYVLQYEVKPQEDVALSNVFPGAFANINTHDMPTFAAFWKGLDIDDRLDLGILDAAGAERARQERAAICHALLKDLRGRGLLTSVEPTELEILKACLSHLGQGEGPVVLVSFEDLWLEERPHNVPGTWRERPNWQRKARYSLEELGDVPGLDASLRQLNESVANSPPPSAVVPPPPSSPATSEPETPHDVSPNAASDASTPPMPEPATAEES